MISVDDLKKRYFRPLISRAPVVLRFSWEKIDDSTSRATFNRHANVDYSDVDQ